MKVHLVDGTYELFRHYYGVPPHANADGEQVAAVRGVAGSIVAMLEDGVTHLGVATDHVIESFRNDMWPGYKTSEGVPEDLLSQFPLLESTLEALGVVVWAMVEYEADDALAAAAAMAAGDRRVEQVVICTPDKDLAQCVADGRVVQLDRRQGREFDEAGVIERLGVQPRSVPDFLALVGDSADGFPGLAGWGAKSAATVLARYGHLEDIPHDPEAWDIDVRGAAKLAATLAEQGDRALLFRDLAELRFDAPVAVTVDDLCWRGPHDDLPAWAARLDAPGLVDRVGGLARGAPGVRGA